VSWHQPSFHFHPLHHPVIFLPRLEFGFTGTDLAVGRRRVPGWIRLDRYSIDGEPQKNAYNADHLWHRKGRYEMEFVWLPDLAGAHTQREFAQGTCYDANRIREDAQQTRSLASDRRFVEPVRIKLVATSFTPLRRLLWHRERLSKAGSEIQHEVGRLDAPFSPHDLAQLSGFALGFPALAERLRCGSKALLWISGKMPL
jgi:hypothetical protein